MTAATLSPAQNPERRRNLRLDIEGLRSVAIGLVLLFHAGLPVTGGFIGVDVFFVLSGFLITGILIRELEKTQRISLMRFYARRTKRLLPATGLVLITTAVLTWWTIPITEWRAFGWDIVAAAGYVVNWVLAGRSVDYLAEDLGASPVQHFWSLAVEEQFYIVWPLLLLAIAWWYRRRGGTHLRGRMVVGILLIALPSLAWSVYYTSTNPEQAFFVTTTRMWEMAIGALVAIGANVWPRMNRTTAEMLGWGGLLAIVVGALAINPSTAWPSGWAAVPTLGTAAVIIAGFVPENSSAKALSIRPAVWVGGLSYSLYLWHWPLLIAADAYWGGLSPLRGVAVVLVSFIPAYLSYRFIENPIRFAPSVSASHPLAISVGVNFSLIGAVSGLALVLAVTTASAAPHPPTEEPQGNGENSGAPMDPAGAGALTGGDDGPTAPGTLASLPQVEWYTPEAILATKDVPSAYADGCQVEQDDSTPVRCDYGDPNGQVEIGVVGDSKILQYQSAFEEIGRNNGIHFVSYTKSGCSFSTALQSNKGEPYTSCVEWNEQVMAELRELGPDAVLTSGRAEDALEDPEDPESVTTAAMQRGITEAWAALAEEGIPVIGVVDNPIPDISVYECVAEQQSLSDCVFDRAQGVADGTAGLYERAHEEVPLSALIDIRDYICPQEECVPVIGNVLVYRQTSHLTDTYVRTLTPMLEEAFTTALSRVQQM